jgi:hypothetical protein
LVCLEYVLSEHRFLGFVSHLTDIQRSEARTIMENQKSALQSKLAGWLLTAYGLDPQPGAGVLDPGQVLEGVEHFQSLRGEMVSRVPAGPSLRDSMEQWLDQALTSQYPAHPVFENLLTLTKGKVQKVLEVARAAAETPNGRQEVIPNERASMRQITVPLRLGTMHETAWVQNEHWKLHFLQQEAAGGGPLTVGALRRAINSPKPMGLPSLLEDLLILAFAAQTNRGILRHHHAMQGELGGLLDDDVLRQEALPSAETWARARAMAEELFGTANLPQMPSATAVVQFVAAVKEKFEGRGRDEPGALNVLADLQRALGLHLANFGVAPETSDRLVTARETASFLRKIKDADGCDFVERVAQASFSSAPAAIARGLTTARETARALELPDWLTMIERAGQVGGDTSPHVRAIREKVATALRHDELVQSLAPVLKEAERQSDDLIFRAARGNGAAPAPPVVSEPPAVDAIDVPLPVAPTVQRARRSTSEVKGDALPSWLPREAAAELLTEVPVGAGHRRIVVSPLVAQMLRMDPQASLAEDGRSLHLPKWNLQLRIEEAAE